MAKGKRYSQQFKNDAVQYRKDHPKMTLIDTANHLGVKQISPQTLECIRKAKCWRRHFPWIR
jgi:hypothetical protein